MWRSWSRTTREDTVEDHERVNGDDDVEAAALHDLSEPNQRSALCLLFGADLFQGEPSGTRRLSVLG